MATKPAPKKRVGQSRLDAIDSPILVVDNAQGFTGRQHLVSINGDLVENVEIVDKKTEIAKAKAKMGRPSKFSQELADRICSQLASGDSLRTVCKADDMPSMTTVFNWFRVHEDFLNQYTRAKQESADAMAEEVLDIADDGTNDWMEINADGSSQERYSLNGEHVQRSRLRIETRKWLMAKMKPKKYGDKLDLTSDGKQLPSPIISITATSQGTDNA